MIIFNSNPLSISLPEASWWIISYYSTCIHTYIHTCMHACMHACIYIYIFIHTYTFCKSIYNIYIRYYDPMIYPSILQSRFHHFPDKNSRFSLAQDTLVYRIRTRSRKGPRPRHQRDHLSGSMGRSQGKNHGFSIAIPPKT